MSISMIGIDHTKASIDVRTIFSFTKKGIAQTLERWKRLDGINGCIILSTCNRMEIWASLAEEGTDLFSLLCAEKKVEPSVYEPYVVRREGEEAVWHLLRLSCGLQSKILGEDQIITQVKQALSLARDAYATDNVLEVLFRMAVTAAKKVKTEVVLSAANYSAISRAVEVLKGRDYDFAGKKCMVIGNGEMGKLSANAFREAGADVTVTVRQYRSGMVEIPKGCSRIDYGKRLELLGDCDYVVSATTSPNFTLTKEQVLGVERKKKVVMIDLAVPRDIEPGIGELKQIELYDIDSFDTGGAGEQANENIYKAEDILRLQMKEFFDWYEDRDMVEKIQVIKDRTSKDFHLRTVKQMRSAFGDGSEKEEENLEAIQKYIELAQSKVINKMLFGMKAKMSEEAFRDCLQAMGEVFCHE